jgi:hypothetical protein
MPLVVGGLLEEALAVEAVVPLRLVVAGVEVVLLHLLVEEARLHLLVEEAPLRLLVVVGVVEALA